MFSLRLAALTLVLSAMGCGRPFFRTPPEPVPVLSQSPAQQGLSPEESVVRFLVQNTLQFWKLDSLLVVEKTKTPGRGRDEFVGNGFVKLPREWPESVQVSFGSAWMDWRARSHIQFMVSPRAVAGLNAWVGDVESTYHPCGSRAPKNCRIPAVNLAVSAVGFNWDSTTAVVYTEFWCGGLCGSGEMWVLRRAPGCEWTVLRTQTLWISSVAPTDSSRGALGAYALAGTSVRR